MVSPAAVVSDVFDVTLVLDTSIYADGDVLAVPQEITYVFPEKAGRRVLESIVILDEDDQGVAMDLIFMNATGTLGTINAAVSITDADARKVIGAVNIATTDYFDLINSKVAVKRGVGLVLKGGASSSSLWIAAVTRGGTPTHTASGIKVKLGFA